jgi:hypothetical protein
MTLLQAGLMAEHLDSHQRIIALASQRTTPLLVWRPGADGYTRCCVCNDRFVTLPLSLRCPGCGGVLDARRPATLVDPS